MRSTRNPFRLRASEQATSDEDFLALFGHRALDLLPTSELWDRLVILAYAPGAGKTTLLRLFTPSVLRILWDSRGSRENRELVQRLEGLSAIGSHGPAVLGMLVDCREQYASIEDMALEPATRLRWFLALLDARVTLLFLRSALTLVGGRYPDEVGRVSLTLTDGSVPRVLAGQDLYREASETEGQISESLDSLHGANSLNFDGRRNLGTLRTLGRTDVAVDGRSLGVRPLVMFDDVQALEVVQRDLLRRELERRDLAIGRWLSERSQVLSPAELLGEARTSGRDYILSRRIDEWPRGTSFEKLVLDIADRRSRSAEVRVPEFSTVLAERIGDDVDSARLREAAASSRRLAYDEAGSRERYRTWLESVETDGLTALDEAIRWRTLAILIRRDVERQQLPLDLPLELSELDRRDESDVRAAAELFASREYQLPYYFGAHSLASLASYNVEQFLEFAGDLFERFVTSATLSMRKKRFLTAVQQDALFREISKRRLANLPTDLPHGSNVHRLVQAIGQLCEAETYRPRAPYAPGATGIAISMQDRDRLCEDFLARKDSLNVNLYNALASAVAHNVLDARPNVRVKGREWLVLYLNRGLCPAYGLPLQYGGFRERPLSDLKQWLISGFVPPSRSSASVRRRR